MQQRKYILGVKNLGGDVREIDVDLLLCGSRSSESLSDLTESESDFSLEALEAVAKNGIGLYNYPGTSVYPDLVPISTYKGSRHRRSGSESSTSDINLGSTDHEARSSLAKNSRSRTKRDATQIRWQQNCDEMEKCMSHFDKVLLEEQSTQNTQPMTGIQPTVPPQHKAVAGITREVEPNASLLQELKGDGGARSMQCLDFPAGKTKTQLHHSNGIIYTFREQS